MSDMTCPKCERTFDVTEACNVRIDCALADDIELRIECPNNDCDQTFYTFVKPDFIPSEN